MKAKPRIIISGGGTGGHIFPALAVINKIKEQDLSPEFCNSIAENDCYFGVFLLVLIALLLVFSINFK